MQFSRRHLIGFAGLALLMSASIQAAQEKPVTVAGTWTVTVKGQGAHGDMTAGLAIRQDGRKLSATLTAHGSDRQLEGEFADGSLTLASGEAEAEHRISLNGRLKDDGTLDGYLSGPMGDLRWTAVRSGGK